MITPKLEIFSVFIFLGAAQSLLLAVYFILKKEGNHLSHYLLASILIFFSLILFDIGSGYSAYIIFYVHLNNFSDAFVFFLGPLCYLYTKSQAQNIDKINPKQYLHFIFPVFFLLYFVMYLMQPDGLKYNDFLNSFHPEIERTNVVQTFDYDPFGILKIIAEVIILYLSIYIFLSIRLINQILKTATSNFFSFTNSTLAPLRVLLSGFVFALLVFSFIRLFFNNDLGDHILATYVSIIVYSITIYLAGKRYFAEEDILDDIN